MWGKPHKLHKVKEWKSARLRLPPPNCTPCFATLLAAFVIIYFFNLENGFVPMSTKSAFKCKWERERRKDEERERECSVPETWKAFTHFTGKNFTLMGSLNAQILMKFAIKRMILLLLLYYFYIHTIHNIYYYIYVIYKAQVQSDINRTEKIFAYSKVIHII